MQTSKKVLLLATALLPCYTTFSQSLKIGAIDIYGNRKISSDIIFTQLSLKQGDSIDYGNFKREPLVAQLVQIPGVKYATVNPLCCDPANNLTLYIGIGETDSVILKHRVAPKQFLELPVQMMTAYRNLGNQLQAGILAGQATENDSLGYALFDYPPARVEQNKFTGFAKQDFPLLENVLKNSRDAEQRAAAAEMIAYSTKRKEVVNDLLYAVDDTNEDVRNNATRALGIIAGYLNLHPGLKITIPATPFIKMVNSIVWTDRNKGASVLLELTQSRDPKLLKQIEEEALPSIIEMAKWKGRGHSFFCFVILGRMADEDESSLIAKNYSNDWMASIKEMVDKLSR